MLVNANANNLEAVQAVSHMLYTFLRIMHQISCSIFVVLVVIYTLCNYSIHNI